MIRFNQVEGMTIYVAVKLLSSSSILAVVVDGLTK